MMINRAEKYATILICFMLNVYQAWGQQDLFTIAPVSFNMRDYDEFSAEPYKDGLVFCSNRTQNIFIARVDSLNMPLLDLYLVHKKDNGKWANPEPFIKEISTNKHEGPFTFSKDNKTLYFTRNEGNVNGIYISTYNGTSWDIPSAFQYNENNADIGHPCLSDDGKRLFFVSNKRGGFGGFDIYVCALNHNRWSQPKNIGSEINSVNDELYPFYNSNGRLYFASNRSKGMGGMDIYFSKENNGKWSSPKLLPAPINSKANDFAYWSDSTDRHGYISSDRLNRSKLCDVFEYTMNFPEMSKAKAQEQNKYTYVFFEQSTLNTDTTTLSYEWDFGDNSKIRGKSLEVEHTFAKTGDYNIQLNVVDSITGAIFMNQAAYTFLVTDIEQPYITSPETASTNMEISMDAQKTYLPEKQITNYYWDFGDESIAEGIITSHTYSSPGTYRIRLSIGYTKGKNQKPEYVCIYRDIIIKAPRVE